MFRASCQGRQWVVCAFSFYFFFPGLLWPRRICPNRTTRQTSTPHAPITSALHYANKYACLYLLCPFPLFALLSQPVLALFSPLSPVSSSVSTVRVVLKHLATTHSPPPPPLHTHATKCDSHRLFWLALSLPIPFFATRQDHEPRRLRQVHYRLQP